MRGSTSFLSSTAIKLQALKMKHQRLLVQNKSLKFQQEYWLIPPQTPLASCALVLSMPWPTIKQTDKPHSPHVGSLARPLLLLSLSIVSRLCSFYVKNKKKKWKEESAMQRTFFSLTISFPDNYKLVHSWVGQLCSDSIHTTLTSTQQFAFHLHNQIHYFSQHADHHSCRLTSLALPPLGRLLFPRPHFTATSSHFFLSNLDDSMILPIQALLQ